MEPETFIFFGRSGCGKGTQAKMLMEYLAKEDPDRKSIYIETGAKIREFLAGESHTAKLVKEVIDHGGLLPEFIPIWIWTNHLIGNFSGNEHLFLDGLSRRIPEAPVLDSALTFYGRRRRIIVFIDVSRTWSKTRLLSRGRKDDNDRDIEARLDWYDINVLPTVEIFKKDPRYIFVRVHGEKTIDEVHKSIVSKVYGSQT